MEPFALIIFGVSSNLAQIKLIPALYDLEEKELLPKDTTIVGIARRDWSQDDFKKFFHEALHAENRHHQHEIKHDPLESLLNKIHYLRGNFEEEQDKGALYTSLKQFLDSRGGTCYNHLYYLATYPHLYTHIFQALNDFGLNKQDNGWVRLMIEKPLGYDLKSAKELDWLLHRYFKEEQIYRLDHYLGKETLQNILTFRFGNEFFEPLLNKDYLDHIQVTAAEDIRVGKRGGYYDKVGALKDVGQNHQLQLIAVTTMNSPKAFTNPAVTAERIKILQKLTPLSDKLIFGQYRGYRQEEKVAPDSQTETYFALKTEIENDRFQGVPIYVRAGKKLPRYVTEVSLIFKTPHNRLFSHLEMGKNPNILTYRVFPNEGIGLQILTKNPAHEWQLDVDHMEYCYPISESALPDAYEKLFYDAIKGDQTFFNDAQEVEAEWAFVDELLKKGRPKIEIYEPGVWGPAGADRLIESDGRHWLEPSTKFCNPKLQQIV